MHSTWKAQGWEESCLSLPRFFCGRQQSSTIIVFWKQSPLVVYSFVTTSCIMRCIEKLHCSLTEPREMYWNSLQMAVNGDGSYEANVCNTMLVLANLPLLQWYANQIWKWEEAWLLKRTGRAFPCTTVNSENRKQNGGWLFFQTFALKLGIGLET